MAVEKVALVTLEVVGLIEALAAERMTDLANMLINVIGFVEVV